MGRIVATAPGCGGRLRGIRKRLPQAVPEMLRYRVRRFGLTGNPADTAVQASANVPDAPLLAALACFASRFRPGSQSGFARPGSAGFPDSGYSLYRGTQVQLLRASLAFASVLLVHRRLPVESGIEKRGSRHICQGAPEAVPALAVAVNDGEPLVRGHAA